MKIKDGMQQTLTNWIPSGSESSRDKRGNPEDFGGNGVVDTNLQNSVGSLAGIERYLEGDI